MSTSMRYKLIPNEKYGGIIIFDAETGAIQYPLCWQDLLAYYNYLVGLGRLDEAQKLLGDSIAGKKPITKMLAHVNGLTPS
jgi:hypothetical protein